MDTVPFTIPSPVEEIFDTFQPAGYEIFLVGGGVRNLLMEKKPADCDFTTNATPEEIGRLFPHSFYNNVFGTVGVPIADSSGDKHVYEITTYRTEQGYSDRRRPDNVAWGELLEEDLKRRDFTINAIAIGPPREEDRRDEGSELVEDKKTGIYELVDMFGGREDLEKGLIRAVGDAEERFREDALRLMRAVRIASQMGFIIEPETFAAVKKQASLLNQIAAERIRDELFKILESPYPADGVMLMFNAQLLEIVLPELTATYGVEQTGHHTDDVFTHSVNSLRHTPSEDPLVRLATLLHDIGKVPTKTYECSRCGFRFKEAEWLEDNVVCPQCSLADDPHEATTFYNHEVVGARTAGKIADRLRLSKARKKKLVKLIRWHQFSVDERQTDKAIRRFIRRVGKEDIEDMINLRIGDRVGSGVPAMSWRTEEFIERIEEVQKQPFTVHDLKISGNDVMEELDLEPGPRVGEILEALFEEVEEDPSRDNREYLMQRLKKMKNEVN